MVVRRGRKRVKGSTSGTAENMIKEVVMRLKRGVVFCKKTLFRISA